jgi:hypothetical protein
MTKTEMMNELGLSGEKVVINMLSAEGCRVETSINKYDSEKDLLVDGKYKVEVKTQAPFVKENAFTFNTSQLRKCQSVDVLYFVSVPHPTYRHYSDGWIYRVVPSEFKSYPWKDKFGNSRICIPIKQDALIPVKKMSDSEAKELQKYISTGY